MNFKLIAAVVKEKDISGRNDVCGEPWQSFVDGEKDCNLRFIHIYFHKHSICVFDRILHKLWSNSLARSTPRTKPTSQEQTGNSSSVRLQKILPVHKTNVALLSKPINRFPLIRFKRIRDMTIIIKRSTAI